MSLFRTSTAIPPPSHFNFTPTVLYNLEKNLDDKTRLYSHQILEQLSYRLTAYEELSDFDRYTPLRDLFFVKVPSKVHRYGIFGVYTGWRLVVERGIAQADNKNGYIVARIEKRPFCFRNSVHGISLETATDWERKILLAILWSSLARYFFFMTTSSWVPWHTEIYLEDGLLSLPIRFPNENNLRERIVRVVNELREWNPQEQSLFALDGLSPTEIKDRQEALERQLDEAIFDLYELSEPERDLILDLCETGLEFFYRKDKSFAVQRVEPMSRSVGTIADLPGIRSEQNSLQGYLYAFLQIFSFR